MSTDMMPDSFGDYMQQHGVTRDALKPGDFIDVRMVAVGVDGDVVTARLSNKSAVHQFTIGRHQVQHTAPRSPEAIAADAVCASYSGIAPLQDRRARNIVTR